MEPLISVIVPIYKVEKYLRECIDSITNQTYKNLEIILVDDGSPDNCGTICDEYSAKDSRIKVIHKENGGLSDARNAGMDIANGDYFVFVDSDDYMTEDGIGYLYELISQNEADIAIGGMERFDDSNKQILSTTYHGKDNVTILSNKDAMKDVFCNGCAAWARIYRVEIHKGIYFPKGEINEDEAIVLKLLDRCRKVVKSDKVIYKYRYRPASITSVDFNKKKLDWYYHCKANVEFIKEDYPELTEYAEKRYASSIAWCLNNMTADTKQFKKEIKWLRKDIKKYLMIQASRKEKFRYFLLAYCYYPYATAVKLLGKHYT